MLRANYCRWPKLIAGLARHPRLALAWTQSACSEHRYAVPYLSGRAKAVGRAPEGSAKVGCSILACPARALGHALPSFAGQIGSAEPSPKHPPAGFCRGKEPKVGL